MARLAALIAFGLAVESAIVWLAHENHLLLGSVVPGIGLVAAAIAVASRTRSALWRVVAVLVACAAWGALSVELFAQRDRELLARVRALRAALA